jgi:hypothetical protein
VRSENYKRINFLWTLLKVTTKIINQKLAEIISVCDEQQEFLRGRFLLKKKKGNAILVTGRGDPWGFETSRIAHFLDNRITDGGEMNQEIEIRHLEGSDLPLAVRLSALCAGRPLPPGRFLVLISVRG